MMSYSFQLVFFHGITNTALPAEGYSKTSNFFSERFPGAFIGREFQFPAIPFNPFSGSADIKEQARHVHETLLRTTEQNIHEGTNLNNVPLVFIGHDLGGCLIKQVMLLAAEESEYRPTFVRIKGIMFFGTPHRGVDTASWEEHVVRLLAMSAFEAGSPTQLLHSMAMPLHQVAEEFAQASWDIKIVNIFQEDGKPDNGPVVLEETFSTLDSHAGKNIKISGSHTGLWGFKNTDAKTETVCEELENMVKSPWQPRPTRDRFDRFLDGLGRLKSETPHSNMTQVAPNLVDWVAKHASYVEWTREPEVRMLHVSGPPGSGTTVLASHIVKLALEERGYRDATILKFVFERHSVRARGPEWALISLCRQLLLARPWLFRLAQPLCDFILEQGLFTRQVLWVLFRSLLQHAAGGTTYCVLYAVHECEEPLDDMIAGLGSLALKTMLTSDDAYAEQAHAWRDRCRSRSIRTGTMKVKELARANVDRIARDKPLWGEFEKDIVEALCAPPESHLEAMHRLMLLEWGDDRTTRAAMRKRLATVRSATFTRPGNHLVSEDWVRMALRWVVHAVRPLTTMELAVAVAVAQEVEVEAPDMDSTRDGPAAIRRQARPRQRTRADLLEHISHDIVGDLLRHAPPLVRLVGSCVLPIHRRLRTSLWGGGDDDDDTNANTNANTNPFGDPHYAILVSCLEYLAWTGPKPGDPQDYGRHRHSANVADETLPQDALVGYASASWPEHYMRIKTRNKPAARSIVRSFLNEGDYLDRWARLYSEREPARPDEPGLLSSPTQAICHLGDIDLLDLSALQPDVHSDNTGELRLALDHAVQSGQTEVVASLLDVGARSERAVRLAAARGRDGLIELLLNVDTGPLSQVGTGGYTALHHAACHGHYTSVELLLDHDMGLRDVCTTDGSSALCLAAKSGQTSVVASLVRLNADWTMEDSNGYDVLHLAAMGGFSEIIDILLPLGANPQKKGGPDGDTAVHLAVRFDHPTTLRKLLRSHGDTELRNNIFYTPLHIAAEEGFLPIIQLLIEATEEPPTTEDPVGLGKKGDHGENYCSTPLIVTSTDQTTPLQLAAARGHIEAVRMLLGHQRYRDEANCSRALFVATAEGSDEVVGELLDHGAPLNVQDTSGNTLLHKAVEGGNANVLLKMLDREPVKRLIDTANRAMITPLHLAAEIGTLAMVYNLLDRGAKPSPQTPAQETPLHLAARRGHRLVVRQLQKHMDTIDHKDEAGHTAFDLAVQGGHVAIVKDLLHERNEDEFQFPFHMHAILKQEIVLRALLESREWNCNKTNEHRLQTPLQIAVSLDLFAAVELLLRNGADVDAKEARGDTCLTPLNMAAQRGESKIVDLLLKHGADIRKADKHGNAPLFTASSHGHVDTVRRLLADGLSQDVVNQANLRGWTALYVAATQDADITQMLLEAGANPHRETHNVGSTPLARAAFNDRRIQVVRHLLAFGAKPNKPDKDGETPVHRAAVGGSVEIMKLFISGKANLNAQRSDGCTPLQLAILSREFEVANLLLDQASVRTDIYSNEHGSVVLSAARTGSVELVSRLLKRDHPDSPPRVLHNLLVAAVNKGDEPMVKLLLECGAKVRVPDAPESNVLFTLLRSFVPRRLGILQQLLHADTDAMNGVDWNGDSVLRVAALREFVDVVEHLVERCASTVHEPQDKEPLLVNVARRSESWQTLEALLKHSPDHLSVRDKYGRGLLAVAIDAENSAVVNELLRYYDVKVNGYFITIVNDRDHSGRTPLISSVLKLGTFVGDLLDVAAIEIDIQDEEGKTALAHACLMNDKTSVARLLDKGASTTLLDIRGRGPLYWACLTASMDVFEQVRHALQVVNPTSYEEQRELALRAAVAGNKPTFLEVLLDTDDDIVSLHPPEDGWTAMYTAKRYNLSWAKSRLQNACFDDEERSPPLPSAWSSSDKTVNLEVDSETHRVTARGGPLVPGDEFQADTMGSVRANYPMSPIKGLGGVYYFEVQIEKSVDPHHWAVGCCEEQSRLNVAVGWEPKSWGYHGDDGGIFAEVCIESADEYKYSEKDTVGCGGNFNTKDEGVFFTRGGKLLATSFPGVRGKLYPSISLNQTMKDAQISTKFADEKSTWDDFVFKGDFNNKIEIKNRTATSEALVPSQTESDPEVSQRMGVVNNELILDEDILLEVGDDDDSYE